MKHPYLGVTGIKNPVELAWATHAFENTEKEIGIAPYMGMIGFLSSKKRVDSPNSTGTRSPSLKDLNNILQLVQHNILPTIHYYAETPESFADDVARLFDYGRIRSNCATLQINSVWPDPKELYNLQRKAGLDIILQIPPDAMKDMNAESVGRRVSEYDDIHYILVDPSAGTGKKMEQFSTIDVMRAIRKQCRNVRLGAAGGIGPDNSEETLTNINGIMGEPISIDAESRLRTQDNYTIHRSSLEKYIIGAAEAISRAYGHKEIV